MEQNEKSINPLRVGINGFGRMGRLALRAGHDSPGLDFVAVNEPHMDSESAAHLLEFDSVQGTWSGHFESSPGALSVAGHRLRYSSETRPEELDWADLGVDVVLESSGKFRTRETLQPFLSGVAGKVLVAAPVKSDALNLVVGVNEHLYEPQQHDLLTAASCTTNCLAPVVKVLHEGIGIKHGSITTLHDLTNTQTIVDAPHKDLRRARAASVSLIPTSTGSATAIGMIFPELEGRLDGHGSGFRCSTHP